MAAKRKRKARKKGGITTFGKMTKPTATSEYGRMKRRSPASKFMGK